MPTKTKPWTSEERALALRLAEKHRQGKGYDYRAIINDPEAKFSREPNAVKAWLYYTLKISKTHRKNGAIKTVVPLPAGAIEMAAPVRKKKRKKWTRRKPETPTDEQQPLTLRDVMPLLLQKFRFCPCCGNDLSGALMGSTVNAPGL